MNTVEWMKIQKPIREKIIELYAIPKSSFVWVKGQELVSDGRTDKDLEIVTPEIVLEAEYQLGLKEKPISKMEQESIESIEGGELKTINRCEICGKHFKNKIGLAGHKRSHFKQLANADEKSI